MTTPGSAASRSSSARLALAAGAAGLVGGLALGATSLAGAVSPSTTPVEKTSAARGAAPAARTEATPARPEEAPGAPTQRQRKAADERRGGGGGLVSAITQTSLTLRTPSGTRTFALNDSTTYYEGKDKATRGAVAVGDVVQVRVVDPKATTPVAASVTVVPAHLAGLVTAIDGDTITVTDHDGFTRKVRTSAQTTVMKDGVASTLSAVTVGSFIRAMGEVAADGTTLDAERIALGKPARPEGGPGKRGGHPGGRPGGPGGGPEGGPANAPAGDPTPDDNSPNA